MKKHRNLIKQPKYSVAKDRAWKAFSKYIRIRDEADGCYTCGVVKPYKSMQAGHWIPGRHNSILFDERGCHGQCYRCNINLKSNPVKYYDRMLKDYGKKVCDELKKLDTQIREYKVYELLEIEAKYKAKCENENA